MRPLTKRERQVIDLVTQAKPNKEIATELHLTEGTVKEHLHAIFRKVGVTNRVGLAIWGVRSLMALCLLCPLWGAHYVSLTWTPSVGWAGSVPTWDSASAYATGDTVAFATSLYTSLIDSNLNNSPDTVTDAWGLTDSLAGYNVYRSGTSGSGYTKINSGLVSAATYDDHTVGSGQYYYVVTAVSALGGESINSSEAGGLVPPSGSLMVGGMVTMGGSIAK